ncbi:hypothetical protein PN499_01770 [Kamptonema animale CS-326]|jgi:hypothetical protein|uniref:hypothetical protein n=1 Tax=Kamptonema animale TaxID=92934 RepID=UPI00232D79FC|nr:hypothetical protein [Kamptonema animale]MDB9509933.1 hypothetical protein [Kamptonema animale CS-326]
MAQGLPKDLKADLTKIKNGVEQWSRLVAWSWTDYLVSMHPQEEEKLKKFFIQVLQEQALYRNAVNIYEDDRMKRSAFKASFNIKKLFMGKNEDIDDSEVANLKLTLPDVYEALIGAKKKSVCGEESMKEYHVEVLTDSFSGSFEEILDPQTFIKEAKEHILEKDHQYIEGVKYIARIAYPPRPAFSPATITEEKLKKWISNKNANDYLPPSAYIPLSMT